MFNNDTGQRLFAAAFSLLISAGIFAYAIIPGSPGMV